MTCCGRRTRKPLLHKSATSRISSLGSSVSNTKTGIVPQTTSIKKPTLLCKYFEQQGSSLLVDVTKDKQIIFRASGSSFNLEESINLYECNGGIKELVRVILSKLKALNSSPVVVQVRLKDLLATLIALQKEELNSK